MKVNNKQNNLSSKSNSKIYKNTQNSSNEKTATKQAPNQQPNKNAVKNSVNTINKVEMNKPIKTTQPKLTPKIENKQLTYVKNPTPPKPYQSTEPTKQPHQYKQPSQFTANHVI